MKENQNIRTFQKTVWNHYKKQGRSLPWRRTKDPYKILVSEIMLQQTQVSRVTQKYPSFIKRFPTVEDLAHASLKDVLTEWQGLGYNRRGANLKKAAEIVVKKYGGKFPKDYNALISLPSIGPATAGDILAFAWNIPVPLIETNIRSVYIHFFFADKEKVSDKEILPLVEQTLDKKNPREWYWALFDYGSYLKESGNPNTKSKHYSKQSKFKGSHREKRSKILKLILSKPQTEKSLISSFPFDRMDISKVLSELLKEGMIRKIGTKYTV